jgi:hypothetical protein
MEVRNKAQREGQAQWGLYDSFVGRKVVGFRLVSLGQWRGGARVANEPSPVRVCSCACTDVWWSVPLSHGLGMNVSYRIHALERWVRIMVNYHFQ